MPEPKPEQDERLIVREKILLYLKKQDQTKTTLTRSA
jgi:hypothetical protein